MAYTRIPSNNTSRNENQLRATIDQIVVSIANLQQIADKMGQMNLDGGGTRIAQEYNLTTEQEATEVYSLVNSAADELKASSPFTQQLVQRLG